MKIILGSYGLSNELIIKVCEDLVGKTLIGKDYLIAEEGIIKTEG